MVSVKADQAQGTGHGLAAGVGTVYVGTGPAPATLPGSTLADVPVDAGHAAAVALTTPRRSAMGITY